MPTGNTILDSGRIVCSFPYDTHSYLLRVPSSSPRTLGRRYGQEGEEKDMNVELTASPYLLHAAGSVNRTHSLQAIERFDVGTVSR